jgi:hypothetical protein
LIDFTGERHFFGRDEIEVKGGHSLSVFPVVTRGLDPQVHLSKHFSFDGSPDQVRR